MRVIVVLYAFKKQKKEAFDQYYLRNFSHGRFNQFAYNPSVGQSGGLITIWNGSLFSGSVVSQSSFQITVKLLCNLSGNFFMSAILMGPT